MKTCDLCGAEYAPKMKSQRYCSRPCYRRAWPVLNREKHNERQRQKRAADPQWFLDRESGYYRKHRTKKESAQPWAYLVRSRKYDAANRNIEFSLTDDWARSAWTGKCTLTGIEFVRGGQGRGPHPKSPTVDKIDPHKGYTPENCRFVLHAVNAMKGSGDDATMFEIARALLHHRP